MLVKELIKHLENMDENSTVLIEVTTKIDNDDDIPTSSSIDSIEFSTNLVRLKGMDNLVEWD